MPGLVALEDWLACDASAVYRKGLSGADQPVPVDDAGLGHRVADLGGRSHGDGKHGAIRSLPFARNVHRGGAAVSRVVVVDRAGRRGWRRGRVQAAAGLAASSGAGRQACSRSGAYRFSDSRTCSMTGSFTAAHLFYLVHSIWWTLVLSALAFVLGSIGGFGVMLARISPRRWLSRPAMVYIEAIQGIPLLILLFIVYFGLSVYGFQVPALVAAGLALMVYTSAYLGDIWRGCIDAMPKPQWEAAECLSLTRWQTLRLVIIPQALRLALPPTLRFLVQVIKMTSLASVIGFVELTRAGQIINNSLFQPFLVFGLVEAFYFALCYPLSRWSQSMEKKLNVGNR